MTSEKKKYTLAECLSIFTFSTLIVAAYIVLVGVPMMLLTAWMRNTMWEWFAVPYFHAPHVGVLAFVAVGLFTGMFSLPSSSLKAGMYEHGITYRALEPMVLVSVLFFFAWILHTWFLR